MNSDDSNTYNSSLTNIPSKTQHHYYPNILRIEKDQKELENLLVQYKNAYQEFVNTAKNINNDSQWVIERNVMIDDFGSSTYLPKTFATNITQEQCILDCLSDPHCDFILFTDSGNGACAANRCLKFSKITNVTSGAGETSQSIQDIISAQNFTDYPDGELVDTPACAFKNSGPTKTNYKFNGWTKPTWFDMPNATFTTKHALGDAASLEECKKMALHQGPYPYIEYTGSSSSSPSSSKTNCYYTTVVDNNLRINDLNAELNANVVSMASQTNAENMTILQNLAENLNNLNGAIHNKLRELEKQNKIVSKKNMNYQSKLDFNSFDYNTAYEKLKNDRTILRKLYDQNNTQDELNENIKKNLNMKKSQYWFLDFLI